MKISLFYDHVTVLDYAYLDEHQGLVGNSLIVNVEFFGRTNEEGVVFDFSHAKKKVKEIIDRDCDHRLVIPKNLAVYEDNKVQLEYKYGHSEETLRYVAPKEAVCEIPYAYVSNHNLLSHLEEAVLKEMPETVNAVKLSFTEEKENSGESFFNYTHGLKQHYGNCQRLMHGHRSTVKVFINGQRNREEESYLANELFSGNIHFCLWDNVVNQEQIRQATGQERPNGRFQNLPTVQIQYEANQGTFEGTLPGKSIYFMEDETTVENLSTEFCKHIKSRRNSLETISVHAFEGIAKGAITTL